MLEPPADYFDTLHEADDLSVRLTVIRALVKSASEGDKAAVQLLLDILPAVNTTALRLVITLYLP